MVAHRPTYLDDEVLRRHALVALVLVARPTSVWHGAPIICEHLQSRCAAILRCNVGTSSTCSVGKPQICTTGAWSTKSKVIDRGSAGSLATVEAVARSRRRTPTRRRRLRLAVVEEEVGVGSAGFATAPTTSPLSAPTASTKTTSAKNADSFAGGKGQDDKEASCSLVGVVEPTVWLAPEAVENFQAVAAAVQANPAVVLLDSGCLHHLMGTKEAFVDLEPSGDVKHMCGFNGALQDVRGRGTVALQGEAGKQVLIPDVFYVPGVQANLLAFGQLKESGVRLTDDGDKMLLVSAAIDVLGRAMYNGRVLCTDLLSCTAKSMTSMMEVARHTFPVKGLDAEVALAVAHINLCGPFRVAAKDGSLYFMLLKDSKTRYVWVRPVTKKSDVLRDFVQWLVVAERQTKKVGDEDGGGVGADDAAAHGRAAPLVWKSEHGPASARTQVIPPTDTSTATLPLLAEVSELADADAEDVCPLSPSPAPPAPPLVANLPGATSVWAFGDERRSGASPVAPATSIASGRRDVKPVAVGVKTTPIGEAEEAGKESMAEQ
ncbi:unnamed protein product [Closterium sp. NIES-53]